MRLTFVVNSIIVFMLTNRVVLEMKEILELFRDNKKVILETVMFIGQDLYWKHWSRDEWERNWCVGLRVARSDSQGKSLASKSSVLLGKIEKVNGREVSGWDSDGDSAFKNG